MIKTEKYNIPTKSLLAFIIPSLLGMLLFMTPIPYEGNITIVIAIYSNLILDAFSNILPATTAAIISISAFTSLITRLFKPTFIVNHPFLNQLFNTTPIWLISRLIGAIFSLFIIFNVGPTFVSSENTGGLILNDLLPILFSVFIFAGMFLPLLLNFGLLEFFGALLSKFMRPVFTLPGRSSIDCVTSWLGDGTIGVLLTSKQYEEGYYTKREAAVIATTFSVVSITFSLAVISQVNLTELFAPYYLAVTLSGVVAAIIIPRIPPLSRKPDTYYNDKKTNLSEEIPAGYTRVQWGLAQAIAKAENSLSLKSFLKSGTKNVLDMLLGVTPIVLAFGTIALIVAEYTPIFQWLGMPFIPILKLLQIPEAVEASQTLVIGFADMFLPSVIGSGIENELTRFVVAAVSVSQLIYMSEVGGLILGSKIPVSMKELLIIFLERTLITLPVIAIIGHVIL